MIKYNKTADPGFGNFSAENVQRFVNKDGTFNIKHINNRNRIQTTFTYLVNISWGRFFLLVLAGYIVINSFFAVIYLLAGIDSIHPSTGNRFYDFLNAFFFSAQTITTVGYGAMSPTGVLTGIISTFQALIGLLSFSFITGLLYGRFARPKSFIKFSSKIICRPFKEGNAIMFRMMNTKKSIMINPTVAVTLVLLNKEGESYQSEFYKLELEREKISYLPTTWTVVHEINNSSPFSEFSVDELKQLKGELVVLATYFEKSFNQDVYQVHSYTLDEFAFGESFRKAFDFDSDGITVLDHSKLDSTDRLNS